MRALTSPAILARAAGATSPDALIIRALDAAPGELAAIAREVHREQLEALAELLALEGRAAIVIRDGGVERRSLASLAREYAEADLGDVAHAIRAAQLDAGDVAIVLEGETVGPRIIPVRRGALRDRITRGLAELAVPQKGAIYT